MERLDKIIVCETDKGNYAVRPLNWAGYWDKDGKIKESGLNHIAVFHYKEDAEWYAETKNSEEQGLLLRLPCKIGDSLYQPIRNAINEYKVIGICYDIEKNKWLFEVAYQSGLEWYKTVCEFKAIGKTVFLTKEEAEQALKQMGE